MQKAPRNLGLYIHVPFCRRKCLYCDFCSFAGKKSEEISLYINALCGEIDKRSGECGEYIVDTIYFGGGTPSLLSVSQIESVLSVIGEKYNVSENVEITLECNPMTHLDDGQAYFASLVRMGVNRLSIGVQSANDDELKLIGRGHSFEDAKRTYFDARGAGIDNISIDLMLGLPSQTMEGLAHSLEEFIALSPEHISIYSLQLEEGTPLHRRREKYDFADEDTCADMYEMVAKMMTDAGYLHYEISNFARDGRESRHNNKYWRLDEYLGFGVAAHSDFSGVRSENTKDFSAYLEGESTIFEQKIDLSEREREFIMLGLRTRRGISKNEFFERFGKDFDTIYGERVAKIEKFGYLIVDNDSIFLNERGFEVSNAIIAEILY